VLVALLLLAVGRAGASTCFGTVAKGRLEGGVALPTSGANFSPYSSLAAGIGRTYVHEKVRDVVVAAYAALQQSAPDAVFVYGETGWAAGGSFKPHRTHQNGLSVDFFVPVREAEGRSMPLPTGPTNRFGYDIEFDRAARFDGYRIDFEALAEHLYQLHLAAKAQGVGIAQVIFDPPFLPKLFATKRGTYLKDNLHFMPRRAWVRHDEHYHVDFALPCKPLK
jgi:penicillin-insensitive murein endopeptidase